MLERSGIGRWTATVYGYEEETGEIPGVMEMFSILTVVVNTKTGNTIIHKHTRANTHMYISVLFLTSACESVITSINISILKT